MKYPLLALEELRERERDEAARVLSDAQDVLSQRTEAVASAVRAHQGALDDLAAHQVLSSTPAGGLDLQLRVAYRDRLTAERDARAAALEAARAHEADARARVESAREALASARAGHRAVELHHEAHRAEQRAAAQAREDEALEEVAALRSRA